MSRANYEFSIRANRDGRSGFYVFIGSENAQMIRAIHRAAAPNVGTCISATDLAQKLESFAADHGVSLTGDDAGDYTRNL
jgi:hypothetical protein